MVVWGECISGVLGGLGGREIEVLEEEREVSGPGKGWKIRGKVRFGESIGGGGVSYMFGWGESVFSAMGKFCEWIKV